MAPVHCSYVISDFRPPAGGIVTASYTAGSSGRTAVPSTVRAVAARPTQQPPPGQGQDGAWYLWRCSGNGAMDALYRPPVWIPNGQRVPGVAGPAPVELAALARKRLRLPEPAIAASPVGDQLVNLPTWLWLGDDWAAVEATAAVPGVTVTARAVPVSVTWDMGDGTSVRCRGPGTPYRAGTDPAAASPDCGHTYRRSSAGMPGGAFSVTATVSWDVSWSGAGGGGVFPGITTTGNADFRVAESQALVTGSG